MGYVRALILSSLQTPPPAAITTPVVSAEADPSKPLLASARGATSVPDKARPGADADDFCADPVPTLPLVVNLALSALGSAIYVVGSVCFYPSLDVDIVGEWAFVVGSAVIVLSQAWKVGRIGLGGGKGFECQNLAVDGGTAFGVEFCAGVGGLGYLVGTWVSLAGGGEYVIYDWWMLGGAMFGVSGLFLCYRHLVMGVA